MEKRKLVQSGLFSFTVSLPKDWVTRHKLKKGSQIFLEERDDMLLLTPEQTPNLARKETKEHRLNVDIISENSLTRDIIASYLMNVRDIRLQGKNLRSNVEWCKNLIAMLPGLEVIEETGESLLIKDFINISELNVPSLLRRSDNIIRSIFQDTALCLKDKDASLAEAIQKRDKEINRLTFLIYKCLNFISEHPQDGKFHGVSQVFATHVWELNGYLEKIGDELKRFSRFASASTLSSSEKKSLASLLTDIETFYLQVMMAFYKNDATTSDVASEKRHEILRQCTEYLSKSKVLEGRGMVSRLTYMLSYINSVSRILRYISIEKDMVIRGPILSTPGRE